MNTRNLLRATTQARFKYTFVLQILFCVLLSNCNAINNGAPAPENLILICADYSKPNQTEKVGGVFTLDINDSSSLTHLAETPTQYGFFWRGEHENTFSPDRTHLAYTDTDGETVKIIGFQNDNEIITTKFDPAFHGMFWSDDGKTYQVVASSRITKFFDTEIPTPIFKYINVRTGEERATDEAATEFKLYNRTRSPDGNYYIKSENGLIEVRDQKTDSVSYKIQSPEDYGDFKFVAWSPDSKQLLMWIIERPTTESNPTVSSGIDWQEFTSHFPHFAKATLFSVNLDGSQLTQLTARGEAEPDITPAWSPDGSRIIYASWLSDLDEDGLAETERTYTSLIVLDIVQNASKEILNDSYDITCMDW